MSRKRVFSKRGHLSPITRMLDPVSWFALYAALVPFDGVLRVQYGGTLTRFLGITVCFMLIVKAAISGRVIRPPFAVWVWAAFVAVAVASGLWAVSVESWAQNTTSLCSFYLFYLVVASSRFGVDGIGRIERAAAIGGVLATLVEIGQFYHGATYGLSGRASLVLGPGRAVDPNFFASGLILPFTIAANQAINFRKKSRIAWVYVGLIAVGMALSGSRGGVAAAVVASATLLFVSRRSLGVRRVILGVVSLLLILGAVLLIPSEILRRFSFVALRMSGASGRLDIWRIGLAAFLYAPWGYGYGNFPAVYDLFRWLAPSDFVSARLSKTAHSIYVQSFTELGLLGGTLLLVALVDQLRAQSSLATRDPRHIGILAGLVGAIMSGTTLDVLGSKFFWLTLMLSIASINASRCGHAGENCV